MKRERLHKLIGFRKVVVAVIVALVFLLPGSAAFTHMKSSDVRPLVDTIVSISPAMQDVDTGETFTVDIYVVPGQPIIGMSVGSLSFNPALIHANSVTEGNLFAGHTMLNRILEFLVDYLPYIFIIITLFVLLVNLSSTATS